MASYGISMQSRNLITINYVDIFKKVQFLGMELEINSNYDFLAVDKDGNLLGFEKKPKLYTNNWLSCWETWAIIGKLNNYTSDWQESLFEC